MKGRDLMLCAPHTSILLPVRDAAATLATCLRSVRRQTRTDWECVIADDGSLDESLSIAESAAGADPRFVPLSLPRAGLIDALNAGLAGCRGTLVARIDADDWMHRDRLALQCAAFDRSPSLDLLGTHVRTFPRDGLGEGTLAYETWLNSIRSGEDVRRDRYVECPLAHPSWMARRDTLLRLGYRDRGWPEDYDLLLRLLEGGGRTGVVPHRLLAWRQHDGRLSRGHERYSLERFTACRAHFLATGFLGDNRDYLLWGYGQTGRGLRRALEREGKCMSGLIEIHRGRQGQRIHGAEVVAPDEIDRLPDRPLIVSVSGAGPRALIRAALGERGRVEGRDFVCAA